ncbi:unnamed protein product [Brassicogethes aeneus]|uniref:non-specific serine/threonine protein kinase n=1 Tax=Brassicogethes aeneus TaxID=1431903 RepID=A0A9P0FCI2_BRAAE|nr:unnamed protein product [Brassicogethes aeneus]
MEGFTLVKQGAEARLFIGDYLGKRAIAKERFEKKYRVRALDTQLTKERIKAECRAIVKCKAAGILTPTLYLADMKRKIIFMEYLEHSMTAKDFVESTGLSDITKDFSIKLGNILARLHSNNIVHGDLTSSNILLVNKNNISAFEVLENFNIALIDFGLASTDASTEDKGVDLYVLERALLSTHEAAEFMFLHILEGYKAYYASIKKMHNYKEVFLKYEDVRARGRKRTMIG